jgi:hypothetical protein
MSTDDTEPKTVELYCRASTTTATAVDRYHTELSSLSAAGAIDDVEVVTWPNRIELSAGAQSEVAKAYERFAEWADEAGLRLAPAFDVESYESEFTGNSGTALVTPIAAVAVYEGDDLDAVYPHVADGEVVDVEDAIDALRTGSSPQSEGGRFSLTEGIRD